MDIENQEHHDAVTTFCQLIYPEQFCGTLSMHSLWTSKPHFLQRKPCDGDLLIKWCLKKVAPKMIRIFERPKLWAILSRHEQLRLVLSFWAIFVVWGAFPSLFTLSWPLWAILGPKELLWSWGPFRAFRTNLGAKDPNMAKELQKSQKGQPWPKMVKSGQKAKEGTNSPTRPKTP